MGKEDLTKRGIKVWMVLGLKHILSFCIVSLFISLSGTLLYHRL